MALRCSLEFLFVYFEAGFYGCRAVRSMAGSSIVTTAVVTTAVVFPLLATLALGLRFLSCSRRGFKPQFQLDTWLMTVAVVSIHCTPTQDTILTYDSLQFTFWLLAVNTFVTAKLGGIDTTSLNNVTAARIYLRVSHLLMHNGTSSDLDAVTMDISLPTHPLHHVRQTLHALVLPPQVHDQAV